MSKLFEGAISCKAILESDRNCSRLYLDKKKRSRDITYITRLAKKKECSIAYLNREEIDKLALGKTHGGILLEADEKKITYLDDALSGFICYIDGVEDPYNLGSITRTLYAAGCQALILPYRDWSSAENVILKASAGAYEKLPIYYVENDEKLVNYCQKQHLPILCAYRKDAISIYDHQFPRSFCLCLGGALRGLSSTIISASDQNLVIEYGREFKNALDSASACAVISFEIVRQFKTGNH